MNPKEGNEFAGMDAALAAEKPHVRRRGLVRLLVGGAGAALVFAATMWLLPKLGLELGPGGLVVAALPGACALVGLIELVSGSPYHQWAGKWDSLKGWQRGVLGTLIVIGFFALLIVGITVFYE